MNKRISVSATEANRSFSKLLREVGRGKRVEITSHGRKVAVVQPVDDEQEQRANQLVALERLEKHWKELEFIAVGGWTREELYERD